MDKSLKKFKIAIIILIILLIIIIGLIFILRSKGEQYDGETQGELEFADDVENYDLNAQVRKVTDIIQYYKIKDVLDRYFQELNNINPNPQTDLQKEESNMSVSIVKKMLSEKYIRQNAITDEVIVNEAKRYKESSYVINNMYITEKTENMRIYLLEIEVEGMQEKIYFIIAEDYGNSSFEIYGDSFVKANGYSEKAENLQDMQVDRIEQNNFNKIQNVNVTNEEMAVNYFNDYKYKLLNNIEKAYSSLDEEYRKNRFTDINEYKQYIQENIDILREIKPAQYIYNQYEDYNEYVCKDQYGNLYIFRENAIMDYALKLDTYTIMTDKFKQEYFAGNDNKKVVMNIDKFIQMINNYDYKAAYKVLNNTFKENNFKTEEEFKEYMQTTYYRYNDIVITDFSDENGTYIYKTTITNKQNSEETEQMNIIMRLNGGTDFEMSFEII